MASGVLQNPDLIFAIIGLPVAALFFWLTLRSLNKLKPKMSNYYPFNLVLEGSTGWTVVYFVVIVALLVGIILIAGASRFGIVPA